ncbi:MAG: WGR domain-containing protein [Chloroflexota bacterium]
MTISLSATEQTASTTPPIVGPRSALLHRINPLCNEARFYYVLVGPALLDRYAVVRVWGRIGGQQRIMVTPCQTDDEARTLANRLIRRRLKRGYTLVGDKM